MATEPPWPGIKQETSTRKFLTFLCIAKEPRESQTEGPEDQGTLKQLGASPELFNLSLVLLAFLLGLPGLPGNPASYPYLEACLVGLTMPWLGISYCTQGGGRAIWVQ